MSPAIFLTLLGCFLVCDNDNDRRTVPGLRVTVGTIIGLLAAGRSREEILKAYPYLEPEDIDQALAYAAWRVEEREVPLAVA